MKNNINQIITPKSKPTGNKRILFLIIITVTFSLILGILIGWSVDIKERKRKEINKLRKELKKEGIAKERNPIDTFTLKFINPFAMSVAFKHIYSNELANFKESVLSYCDKEEKNANIQSISVYFRDLTNGFWFGIKEDEKYVPASLNKVTVLIGALLKAESDSYYLKKKLLYPGSKDAAYLRQHPEIEAERSTLEIGNEYSVEKLLNLMICESDNEATKMLVDDMSPEYLYQMKTSIGIKEPRMANQKTNTTSVKTYSSYFRILYNSSMLNRKYSNYGLEILSRVNYNKGIRKAVPPEIVVCHKFGERDSIENGIKIQILQLHQAGIVYYPGKPFFICIMIKGSNKAKMEEIIYTISKMTYNEIDKQVKQFSTEKIKSDVE
ncbi:serine hydrolase [Bacteroidota bacterium]